MEKPNYIHDMTLIKEIGLSQIASVTMTFATHAYLLGYFVVTDISVILFMLLGATLKL